jgi:hypothetical protein
VKSIITTATIIITIVREFGRRGSQPRRFDAGNPPHRGAPLSTQQKRPAVTSTVGALLDQRDGFLTLF